MNILYFFTHAFFPIRTGAHVRILQTAQSLSRLGFNMSCAYLETASMPQTWSERRQLELLLFENTYRYSEDRVDRSVIEKSSSFWDEVNREIECAEYRPDYFGCVCSSMRKWFSQCLEDSSAQAVILPYPRYAGLLQQKSALYDILELYDTDVHNEHLQKCLRGELLREKNGFRSFNGSSEVLKRTFLDNCNLSFLPYELASIASFSSAVTLVDKDKALVEGLGIEVVEKIPVMMDPCETTTDYSAAPCIMLGPNYFNLQGLLHFVCRVLPCIRKQTQTFKCKLFGSVPHRSELDLGDELDDEGFVPDISMALSSSGYLINPVFSGTGMQIKTVEAMAHGLAVVCYDNVAESAGIRHGETGMVATNESEFADGVVCLHSDASLRKRMGLNAREYVRGNLSAPVLDEKLAKFMSRVVGKSFPDDVSYLPNMLEKRERERKTKPLQTAGTSPA